MERFNITDSDPERRWFQVGSIDVTTTVLITGLAALCLLSYAIDPDLQAWLVFDSEAIIRGQLWRIITWPVVTPPDIWGVIGVALYFYFGTMIEARMGRQRYAWFTGICVVVPAAIIAVLAPLTSTQVFNGQIRLLEMAIILAFILIEPHARSFFGIPFWVLGAVILAIDVIQMLGQREWLILLWVALVLGAASLLVRAYSLTEFEQIPLIPLPSSVSGDPYAKANRARERKARSKGRTSRPGRDDVVVPIHREDLSRAEQADMDRLLDKISETGMVSLDAEERRRLDAYSRRLRES